MVRPGPGPPVQKLNPLHGRRSAFAALTGGRFTVGASVGSGGRSAGRGLGAARILRRRPSSRPAGQAQRVGRKRQTSGSGGRHSKTCCSDAVTATAD